MKGQLFVVAFLLVLTTVRGQGWSACSKSCGGGKKTRQNCLFPGFCSTIFVGCNNFPCVSGWGTWEPCSKTCGGGTKFKVDHCTLNSLTECPKTYDDCNTHACTPLASCPSGYMYRYNDRTSCCRTNTETCGKVMTSARRVIGGKEAKPGQWRWMAAIVRKTTNSAICGGSLIHQQWVLTAAHCFDPPQSIYVLLGSVNVKSPSFGHQKREMENYYNHEQYSYPKNDISLVKLKTAATINSHVQLVCLPRTEIAPIDKTCIAIGWGKTQNNVNTASDILMQVGLRILPLDACIQGHKRNLATEWPHITSTQHMCVGILKGDKDTCTGDSGGPIVCQRCSSCGWYVAATTSFGPRNCGQSGVPGVYMDVRRYEYWIRQKTQLSAQTNFVC